jgi:hypothetical protein
MYLFIKEIKNTQMDYQIIENDNIMQIFSKLNNVTGLGGFTAYQYIQDLSYSDIFEWDAMSQLNTFCSAGIGTVRGIERVFDIEQKRKIDYSGIVLWTHQNFKKLMKEYGYWDTFRPLPNYLPAVADLSNCFCETDKYIRAMGCQKDKVSGKRMKVKFSPSMNSINYIFPPKLKIKNLV